MYPAQALADGLYTAADLPDAFIEYAPAGSITYTKLDPPISEFSGLWYYEATISGVVERLGIASNPSLWTYQGQGESGPCLITTFGQQAPGREDQFADTYTASGVPVPGGGTESVSLSRISLCVWQGVDSCGGPVLLSYDGIAEGSGGPFGTYHWYITWVEYPFFNLFGCNSTPEGYGLEKTDPQSSPAGTYEGNATITVS